MRRLIYQIITKAIYFVFFVVDIIIFINDNELGKVVGAIGATVIFVVEIVLFYLVRVKDIFHLKETEDRIWNFKYEKEKKDK